MSGGQEQCQFDTECLNAADEVIDALEDLFKLAYDPMYGHLHPDLLTEINTKLNKYNYTLMKVKTEPSWQPPPLPNYTFSLLEGKVVVTCSDGSLMNSVDLANLCNSENRLSKSRNV